MRLTEFHVGLSRTINTGKFESARFEIGITAHLNEGDSATGANGLDPANPDDAATFTKLVESTWANCARLLTAEKKRRLPPPETTHDAAGDTVTST